MSTFFFFCHGSLAWRQAALIKYTLWGFSSLLTIDSKPNPKTHFLSFLLVPTIMTTETKTISTAEQREFDALKRTLLQEEGLLGVQEKQEEPELDIDPEAVPVEQLEEVGKQLMQAKQYENAVTAYSRLLQHLYVSRAYSS